MKRAVPIIAVLTFLIVAIVYSHCQIPCGIYDDQARLDLLAEHITTIEKSINQIHELSATDKPNHNQLVRWINNKDDHADQLARIVTYYFMAQRIKPAAQAEKKASAKYLKQLTLLHEMLIISMKCKQTTNLANVEKLKALLADFKTTYITDA